ncbi:transposase [Finegoldia dalianensis]|uniref:Transposase n=1 Tax=Finegoldia dalianensis TaxID=3145239 RepID=A0ABW9KDW1_9FIRM
MSIETLEKTFEKTIKELSNLSLNELRELVKEKHNILDDIEYELAVKKAHGSLSKVIDLDKNFGECWLENFQDPFWDNLLANKSQKEFQERICKFQKDIKNIDNVFEVEDLLDVFYDDFKMIQENWLEMSLWDNISNEEIFDKEALINFIEVLDNYKDYLLYEE